LPFPAGAKADRQLEIKRLKMKNPEETSEKFSQRDLKIGLAGLGMAAVLISLFLLLMTFLSHVVAGTFANSLPLH
jgi:hypothetical protein